MKRFVIQQISVPEYPNYSIDDYRFDLYENDVILCKFAVLGISEMVILTRSKSNGDRVIRHYLDGRIVDCSIGEFRKLQEAAAIG